MTDGTSYDLCDADGDAVYDTAPPLIFALIRENERDQRRLDRLAARNLRRELSYVRRIQAATARKAERRPRA